MHSFIKNKEEIKTRIKTKRNTRNMSSFFSAVWIAANFIINFLTLLVTKNVNFMKMRNLLEIWKWRSIERRYLKFEINYCVPVRKISDTALAEVKNLENWAGINRMFMLLVVCILLGCETFSVSLKISFNELFDSLIMSLFLCGLEVWASAYQRKYLD